MMISLKRVVRLSNLFLVNPVEIDGRLALFWNDDINLIVHFSRGFLSSLKCRVLLIVRCVFVCMLVPMIVYIENSGRS